MAWKPVVVAFAVVAGLGCGKVSNFTDAAVGDDTEIDGAVIEGAHLTVSPLTHQFGPVPVGTPSSTATFTFTNDGTAAATGCAAPEKSGANADDFAISADNCGTGDLAAGGSCTVLVSVTPAASGIRTMTLTRTCDEGGTATTTADEIAVNRPMYIFISSVSYDGGLGGLDGADQLCDSLGAAGTLSAPLGRTWKALLSQTTGGAVNARDRVEWTGPMFDLSGATVTLDPSTWPWVNAGAGSDIGVNENGGPPDDSYVWTGSTIDGVTRGAGADCNGWTDATGAFNGWSGETASFPSTSWFDSFSNGCADQWFGLYCVGE